MLFDQSVLENSRTKKVWAALFSLLVQIVVVGILILIPLIYTEVLPSATLISILTAPPPPPPPAQPTVKVAKVPPRPYCPLCAPPRIPDKVDMTPEPPRPEPPPEQVGPASGPPIGLPFSVPPPIAPPPPPPVKEPPKAPTPTRIRVGGDVQQANLIKKIVPAYPPLAKTTRTQGTVRLTAVISKDGTVSNLQLITGPPLLIAAAMEAVRQWLYRPTLLNGEPVEVVTQIDVNFTLSQ